ncbi:hypothetical protein GM661_07655 [Iocasia frigidifontis]|uniref:Uncharacterized protein n=1 Tax=Iocasia fonsfrigidae TaxID=2682810 RepID=A0A8A7KEJ5_9FIRM|nr:hypothetical protein [Iocasia fonsfrigidae]QTL97869.1 hypothetical protein GM661_07655 [Iocasia fonsfrigidae]
MQKRLIKTSIILMVIPLILRLILFLFFNNYARLNIFLHYIYYEFMSWTRIIIIIVLVDILIILFIELSKKDISTIKKMAYHVSRVIIIIMLILFIRIGQMSIDIETYLSGEIQTKLIRIADIELSDGRYEETELPYIITSYNDAFFSLYKKLDKNLMIKMKNGYKTLQTFEIGYIETYNSKVILQIDEYR